MPENTRDSKGHWLPGVSGNPKGKPKGATSITAMIRKALDDNPELVEELVTFYLTSEKHRAQLWEMLDGRPRQATDITSDGERIMYVPSEIMEKHEVRQDPVLPES